MAGLGAGGPPVKLAHQVLPGARPLSHEDLSILALENETVAGHTSAWPLTCRPKPPP